MKTRITDWNGTMTFVLLTAMVLAGNALSSTWQQQMVRIPEITTPRIEKMIDVGGRKLNCSLYGKGTPAVVFISGFQALQNYWNPIIPATADLTTAISYDRAGLGKSELGSSPCDGETSMKELSVLLGKTGVPGPYMIIAHSLGGRLARIFASKYPHLTAGLILIDTGLEDPRSVIHGGAPPITINPNGRTEAECNDLIWEQAKRLKTYPQVPYTVLTAGKVQMYPGLNEEERKNMKAFRDEDQKNLARLIKGGKHIIVPHAGHNIVYDDPEVVIQSIKEMIRTIWNR